MLIVGFLDDDIIGEEFENQEKLTQKLNGWQEYAAEAGVKLHSTFGTIKIYPETESTIVCSGDDGDFPIAVFEERLK